MELIKIGDPVEMLQFRMTKQGVMEEWVPATIIDINDWKVAVQTANDIRHDLERNANPKRFRTAVHDGA